MYSWHTCKNKHLKKHTSLNFLSANVNVCSVHSGADLRSLIHKCFYQGTTNIITMIDRSHEKACQNSKAVSTWLHIWSSLKNKCENYISIFMCAYWVETASGFPTEFSMKTWTTDARLLRMPLCPAWCPLSVQRRDKKRHDEFVIQVVGNSSCFQEWQCILITRPASSHTLTLALSQNCTYPEGVVSKRATEEPGVTWNIFDKSCRLLWTGRERSE